MEQTDKYLFESKPVAQAVMTMAVPTIISQIVTVIYNMADTFFVGQTGDPNQIAAANLCMPIFMFLTSFSNLFGIGGSSLISRSLGCGDIKKARQAASFSIWMSIMFSLFYGLLMYSCRRTILIAFGANEETYDFCAKYLFWTVYIGAVPTVMNTQLAHLVRAEGHSKQASIGMTLGALLNIVLDPVFIIILRMEIAGAAFATMISNSVAALYFLILINRMRNTTVIILNPKEFSLKNHIPSEIFLTGLPSALMSLMSTFSNVTLNKLMSGYSNEAIAGVGIAKRIDMLSFGVAIGISQGVVPLIGYNYAAKNYTRMKKAIKTTFFMALSVTTLCAVLLFTCAQPIVRAFIDDAKTVEYGKLFQRIICITGPCISVTLIVITVFQGVGKKVQPLFLSMLRKGGLDVPFMLLMNKLAGVNGIVWATPIADFGAMVIAIILFIPFWKSLRICAPQ